jgi:hypothetical protein
MGIGAAIIGASALSAGAGILGSSAASSAQQNAANTAAQTQLNIYGQNKTMLQPWNDAGYKAYGTLNDLLGVGGNSATMQKTLEGLPGYQFTLGQGLKSTQNSAAARGLASSGAALKGAAGYATGLANSQYGSYAGQLQSSANTGLSAGAALAGVGTKTGEGVANSQIQGGNAAAAGYNGMASSVSNAAGAIPLYSMLNSGAFGGGGGQVSGPFNNFDLSMVP